MLKILVLCAGNFFRSQMVEGFLKSFDQKPEEYSAGINPADVSGIEKEKLVVFRMVKDQFNEHFYISYRENTKDI